MKKLLIFLIFVCTVTSCGLMTEGSKSLYYWGGSSSGTTAYEDASYQFNKSQSPAALCRLLCIYEDMVSHPGGQRGVPAPGICAEYGYLLLQPETATIFANNATEYQKKLMASVDFIEKGKAMFQKEIELYPESVKFLAPVIKKFTE